MDDEDASGRNFGWKTQTYSAYAHLLIVKLWNRVFYGSNEEPERVGEAYKSMWDKWSDFWTDAPSEVLPNLFVGSAKNAADAGSLERLNIQYVVNCTCDLPNFHEGVESAPTYGRVPLSDVAGASLFAVRDSVEVVVAEVLERLSKGEPTLIHCMMGASRSVAIATLCMMKMKQIPAREAYARILLRRRAAKINTSFLRDVEQWRFDDEE